MTADPDRPFRYPLGRHHRDEIATRSGRPLTDLDLARVLSGQVSPDDVSVSAETLELQAGFARKAGYGEVAENLLRAAEMTRIPSTEILEIYEAMRPGRSTYYQLLSLSQRIASMYEAEHTGAYIREAAEAYRDTGLLKMEEG
ncbi:diol dehydratase small subunit [Thalassorhabdomicrobium marinisediminis]|uniref:diol dehydratase small subunit n=1 Tax=Thalassorhabdomicrobium marinisediminis TaxID=2170577 RepID=UPI002491B224|nr:diol dehydratase small subunit [Thalassorhabdomicrobium marinisediminis]